MFEQIVGPQKLANILEQGERTSETRVQTKAFLEQISTLLEDRVGPLEGDVGTKAHSDTHNIQFIDRAYFYLAPDLKGTYFPLLTVYLFPGQLWWGLYAWGKESFAEEVSGALQDLDLVSAHELHKGTGAFYADEAWGTGSYVSAGRQLSVDEVAARQDIAALANEIAGDLTRWWRKLQPRLPELMARLGFVEGEDIQAVPADIDIAARLEQWKQEVVDQDHPNHFHADLDWPAQHYTTIVKLVEALRENPESFGREDVVALFDQLNSGTRMKNKVADSNPLPDLRKHLLELLFGEGEPYEQISGADKKLRFAGENMLGELYGWVHAEEAPLYNQCATDALRYLGYDFEPNDYKALVQAHEQFKPVYEYYVGRLRPDIPLNLEISSLRNMVLLLVEGLYGQVCEWFEWHR